MGMNKAEFTIYLQTSHGMSLADAKKEAEEQYKDVAQPSADPVAVEERELTAAEKEQIERQRARALKTQRIEEGWIDSIQRLEQSAQQAVYKGEVRRASNLANDKMYAKRRFQRITDRL